MNFYGFSQTDTLKIERRQLNEAAKELVEYDGVKIEVVDLKMIIMGYEWEVRTFESELAIANESKSDCLTLNAEKDVIIYDQDDQLNKVKGQRNKLGGTSLLLLLLVILLI